MVEVRFRLLGPMEILVDGAPSKLPGTAERALLVQLLLAPGRTVPATMLVDRLWSESSLPVDPMNALQIRVSKVRRALRAVGIEDLVTREGVGYRAAVDPGAVDALEFAARIRSARAAVAEAAGSEDYEQRHLQAYDDALALWTGPPLSDFSGEHWATAEAARLTELHLAALTERSRVALALGRHLEVAADLEPLVATDPTLESLAALLMVALYRSGRQADALEVYTRTREVLDETLGLEPSVSLRSLHERVLRQDESLGRQPDIAAPVGVAASRGRSTGHAAVPTNLPTVVRPLIGRDGQLASIAELLPRARLLSLIGPGGAGKTALAVATAVQASSTFPDGAFAVRLAAVSRGDQVSLATADALGVPLDGAAAVGDVSQRVVSYLARRRLLLLMDNCEHVVDAAAGLIEEILGRCPEVTVIATSREALALPDEVQVTVGPLEAPPAGTTGAGVLDYAAPELFVERARAVRPTLSLEGEDLAAIGRISRSLDGIPLALELAAARVASMSPAEISERLEQRFTFLTSGARTAEARQQTLRATVDWSYRLLTEVEQRVFDRLSVFRGGWTLSGAEAVAADEMLLPGQVLDVVGRLVERSMLVVEPGAPTRYRMLETLRQYAAEQLAARGEADLLAERHARYYRQVAEQAEVDLRGQGQRATLRRLREEQHNIRAAISWMSRAEGDLDSALATAGALGMFWHLGRHLEGREVLSRLIASPGGSPAARARALQALSIVERPRGCLVHPHPGCAEAAAQSLTIFEELGESWRAALSKVLLAVEGVTGADRDRSEALLAEADEHFTRTGDRWGSAVIGFVRLETALKTGDVDGGVRIGRATAEAFRQLEDPWGLSAVLYHLGWGLRQFGRFAEGARTLEEAIDVATSADLWNTVQWALADLAIQQVHLGDRDAAKDLFDRAASASQEIGDGAGEVLAGYGYGLLAEAVGDWDEARRRYREAVVGFERLGTPVMVGASLAGLGRCDEADGDLSSALAHHEQALAVGRRLGEPAVTAAALEGTARVARRQGHAEQADRKVAEASSIREQFHRPAPPHERGDVLAAAGSGPAGPSS